MASTRSDPHQNQPLLYAGAPPNQTRAAMLLVHGRGATAEDILQVAGPLAHSAFAYLAPQAAGNTWYPNSFLAPTSSNEPDLSSALGVIAAVLGQLSGATFRQSARSCSGSRRAPVSSSNTSRAMRGATAAWRD